MSKVTPIGNSYDVTGGMVLCKPLFDGKGGFDRVSKKTAIGNFAAMANGAVTFCSLDGEEKDLADEEVAEILRILMDAKYYAQMRRELLTGHNLVRVSRSASGEVTVEHRGETRQMRLSKLRGSKRWGYRKCTACKQSAPALWIDATKYEPYANRDFYAEVCEACVASLANAPTGIRKVTP